MGGAIASGKIAIAEVASYLRLRFNGQFEEEVSRLWLRWCDQQGQVIPTGAERAEAESQRAEAESQRAERLAERLWALGVNPDEI